MSTNKLTIKAWAEASNMTTANVYDLIKRGRMEAEQITAFGSTFTVIDTDKFPIRTQKYVRAKKPKTVYKIGKYNHGEVKFSDGSYLINSSYLYFDSKGREIGTGRIEAAPHSGKAKCKLTLHAPDKD